MKKDTFRFWYLYIKVQTEILTTVRCNELTTDTFYITNGLQIMKVRHLYILRSKDQGHSEKVCPHFVPHTSYYHNSERLQSSIFIFHTHIKDKKMKALIDWEGGFKISDIKIMLALFCSDFFVMQYIFWKNESCNASNLDTSCLMHRWVTLLNMVNFILKYCVHTQYSQTFQSRDFIIHTQMDYKERRIPSM